MFTSFITEQKISDKKESPPLSATTYTNNSVNNTFIPELTKPRPPNNKLRPSRNPVKNVTESNILTNSEPQRDLKKLEDIRKGLDSLFLTKQKLSPPKPPFVPLTDSSPKDSLQKPIPLSPSALQAVPPRFNPKLPHHSPLASSETPVDLSFQKDNYRTSLITEQDSDIKKMSIEIPREHSHSLLPLTKHTSIQPFLPTTSPTAPLSKEKSPINSRVSIGTLLPSSASPQDGSFSSGQLKHTPLSLREQRISNAVHNIAELPSELKQSGVTQRSRTRSESFTNNQLVNNRLNNINLSEHYPLNKSISETEGRHSVAGESLYTPHSPIPAHISKLMQLGRNTSMGINSCNGYASEHVRLNGVVEQNEVARYAPTKPVLVSLSSPKAKAVTFPNNSETFTKTVMHTHPPPSPRRTPSPSKRIRPS